MDESINLLSQRISEDKKQIDEMVNEKIGSSPQIDTSKHLNKLIVGLKDHAGVVFTSSVSLNENRTTLDILLRIKEYFDRAIGKVFSKD